MDIGVIFPQTEVGGDRGACAPSGRPSPTWATAHLAAYDHVLGGDTAVLGDLGGPYTIDDTFREPLTMFAYLAGCTDLAFATSILIGPQRQTALLAKQAAEVDLLCGGPLPARARHRLEQARVRRARHALRRSGQPFWRSRSPCCAPCGRSAASPSTAASTTSGRRGWPRCRCSGRSRSGSAATPRRRCAGWGGSPTAGSPWSGPGGGLEAALEIIREGAAEAGRDLSGFQFEGRLEYATRDHDKIAEHAAALARRPGRATCRSTRCTPGCRHRLPTSPRSRRWHPSCCNALGDAPPAGQPRTQTTSSRMRGGGGWSWSRTEKFLGAEDLARRRGGNVDRRAEGRERERVRRGDRPDRE